MKPLKWYPHLLKKTTSVKYVKSEAAQHVIIVLHLTVLQRMSPSWLNLFRNCLSNINNNKKKVAVISSHMRNPNKGMMGENGTQLHNIWLVWEKVDWPVRDQFQSIYQTILIYFIIQSQSRLKLPYFYIMTNGS